MLSIWAIGNINKLESDNQTAGISRRFHTTKWLTMSALVITVHSWLGEWVMIEELTTIHSLEYFTFMWWNLFKSIWWSYILPYTNPMQNEPVSIYDNIYQCWKCLCFCYIHHGPRLKANSMEIDHCLKLVHDEISSNHHNMQNEASRTLNQLKMGPCQPPSWKRNCLFNIMCMTMLLFFASDTFNQGAGMYTSWIHLYKK